MDEAKQTHTADSISVKLPAVCRTCLTDEATALDPEFELYQMDEIFLEEEELTTQVHSFGEVLTLFVNDEIGKKDDRLPKSICLVCVEKARAAFQFIEMCRQTDSLLVECLSKPAPVQKFGTPVKVDESDALEEVDLTEDADEDDKLKEDFDDVDLPESIKVDGLIEYTDQATKEKFTLMCIEDNPERKNTSTKEGSSKKFECDICHKKFTQTQTLTRHKKIHSKDSIPAKTCEYCSRTFIRSDDLRRHIRIHTNERPYACDQCPRAYKQSYELKEHRAAFHPEEGFRKMLDCDICGKQLSTRNGLYVHMKAHKGEKNHGCSYCGKRFVTSGELTSHLRHIHPKEANLELLPCGIGSCTQKFVTKNTLLAHRKKHKTERNKTASGSE